MRLPSIPDSPPGWWPHFSGRVRGEALTARLGSALGLAFGLCFVTGYLSHLQYHPLSWFPIPAMPSWGYRLTQGLHVVTGIAAIPLLLAKLWSVYPKLFKWPLLGSVLSQLERLSIAALVATALLEVGTGFLNILNWYPWPWQFTLVHYLLAFVVIGSILLHIAVKLPVIKRGWATELGAVEPEIAPANPRPAFLPAAAPAGNLTRRGALITAGAGVGLVALTTSGQSLRPLEPIALLAPRRPKNGPLGIPINRTAAEVDVTKPAQAPTYRLQVTGPKPFDLDVAALEALPVDERHLPISCVEGWSAGGHWRGPSLYDLVQRAGGTADSVVRIHSLQKSLTPESLTTIRGAQMRAALLATHLNGVRIPLDHGYPVRLIAPDRAGALNTKWIARIEVAR